MQALKKLIILSFTLVLFISTTGVSVYSHFCKNDGLDTRFFLPVDHTCKEKAASSVETCCKLEENHAKKITAKKEIKSNCCQDEFKSFKVTDHFSQHSTDVLFTFYTLPERIALQYVYTLDVPTVHSLSQPYNRPPPKSGTDILIQHQVFRI